MAVKFKLSPKTNFLVQPPQTRYFPRAVQTDILDFKTISKNISYSSSLTESDVYGVMIAVTNQIINGLQEGKIVRFGDLGSFQISLQGNGTDNQNDLGKDLITSQKVIFRPGNDVKKMIKSLKFERMR